jgi:TolB-like protein/DNA-binding winged helix-turn-helix (wHTH) protein/tetratricopeptide (TPR) repeat protein
MVLTYKFESFEVDEAAFRLTESGVPVVIEPKALRLLIYLLENPGRLLSKKELLTNVWEDANVGDNALTRSVALLRKALGDDSRQPRFIETAPTVGYRFVATVQIFPSEERLVATDEVSRQSDKAAPAHVSEAHPKSHSLRGRIALVLVGLVMVVTALGWRVRHRMSSPREIHSIAVLPLENLSGNPDREYFADGTTDELITELARIPNLRVVSRSSVMQEKGSHKSLREIADELDADAVIEGSVVLSGDRVRINAKLVDTKSDTHLWSSSFEGNISDIVSLEDGIAREVASHAKLATLSVRPNSGGVSHVIPAEAHDAYLRGLYYYDRRDALKSVEYFQRAIDHDPLYSSAYAGMAIALNSEALLMNASPQTIVPKATAAARKAVELEPDNGDAYIALGTVEQTLVWDWNAAERDLQHGLELNKDQSTGLMVYAFHRLSMGDPDGAIGYARHARDNDPLSFFMARQYASVLFYARHYDEALAQLQLLQQAQPNAPNVIENWISWIYEKKAMYDEAVSHDLLFMERNDPAINVAAFRKDFERRGWKGYWLARLNSEHPLGASGCKLYDLGIMYERTGDHARALSSLDEAARQRCFWMASARVDPLLDDLRSDAGFYKVLDDANLGTQ